MFYITSKLCGIDPGCQALLTDKFCFVNFNGNRHAIKQSILTFKSFDPKDLQELDPKYNKRSIFVDSLKLLKSYPHYYELDH